MLNIFRKKICCGKRKGYALLLNDFSKSYQMVTFNILFSWQERQKKPRRMNLDL